jgi:hypothetical protein
MDIKSFIKFGPDLSVEFLHLDHNNQYSNGWSVGPSLPRYLFNARIFQYQNSIMVLTRFSDFILNSPNTNLTFLSSPQGNWTLGPAATVGGFPAVSLLVPDNLVSMVL